MDRGLAMALNVNTDLINRAQQGDVAVITALYDAYHVGVYRYLYYRVESREAAEDLTSEVFLRMLRFISGFQPPGSSFQAWLFQIARNLAIDHHRKMRVRDHLPLEEDLVAGSDRPEAAAERSLTNDTLRAALAKLSDEQRDVILMRFIAEMPIAEVAKSLHKSENSIKGLQRRALTALRDILTHWEVSYD
jgi:RNA polymerase sigma-70 factor (ECF subfamily)